MREGPVGELKAQVDLEALAGRDLPPIALGEDLGLGSSQDEEAMGGAFGRADAHWGGRDDDGRCRGAGPDEDPEGEEHGAA